jgi:hypothetical protein
MPPKVATQAETTVFVFERDRMLQKFNVDNFVTRSKVQPIEVPLRKSTKDPAQKLKERLDTYHNVRKMRTDYKNYVKIYGTPEFGVPEEIKTL